MDALGLPTEEQLREFTFQLLLQYPDRPNLTLERADLDTMSEDELMWWAKRIGKVRKEFRWAYHSSVPTFDVKAPK